MDTPETTTLENPSLAADLAKSFAVSTVTTVGMIAGFAVVGYAKQKFDERRSKKSQSTTE